MQHFSFLDIFLVFMASNQAVSQGLKRYPSKKQRSHTYYFHKASLLLILSLILELPCCNNSLYPTPSLPYSLISVLTPTILTSSSPFLFHSIFVIPFLTTISPLAGQPFHLHSSSCFPDTTSHASCPATLTLQCLLLTPEPRKQVHSGSFTDHTALT